MKFLITNDDGIDAPGISSLVKCVQRIAGPSADIVVVAPDRGRSECGHGVTSDRPLKILETSTNWFSVDGTPVDCIRVALASLAKDVDVVLSGVNQGANLGIDILVSGTVAAAREASLHGITSIAMSHYRHPDVPKTWDHVPMWSEPVLRELISRAKTVPRNLGHVWNVNLPAVDPATLPDGKTPEIQHCPLDANPHSRHPVFDGKALRFEYDFQNRKRDVGTDVELCFAGAITVTKIDSVPVSGSVANFE